MNVSSQLISSIFKGELLRDTIIGSVIGSISAGNPITSYIIGAELLKERVSLFAITAFIPFSVLLTSSIVQDGHGMLPLLSYTMRDSILIKIFNLLFGLGIGAFLFILGF